MNHNFRVSTEVESDEAAAAIKMINGIGEISISISMDLRPTGRRNARTPPPPTGRLKSRP